jgi:NADH-quinone oxidoreductase subunit G
MIDVCPVGALTDKTFRFKNRVWFTKPVDAHRDCPTCCGKVTLWQRGDEVLRVTARKDEWHEVQSYDGKPGWICNTCRYDKKKTSDWVIEGLTTINRHSVIAQNKYPGLVKPNETITEVMGGRDPKLLMDIHDISDVNDPSIDLSKIDGPATSKTFEKKEQ